VAAGPAGCESTPGRWRRCRLTPERAAVDGRAERALDALRDKSFNFDDAERTRWSEATGWKIDDYCQPLAGEGPGPPDPGGTWERAKQLLRDYEFADPKLVRATFRRDAPLEGRDMLLEVRFLGLRFHLGVRVTRVIDATREVDGHGVRVWGWDYATLQGHLEAGEMGVEVWKWLDSGTVEFRVHVVSRPGRIRNPLIRIGFRLFGRRAQVRFAKRSCERMASLVEGVCARSLRAQEASGPASER
jgi:uncharacterized protein (UPF0548 family)